MLTLFKTDFYNDAYLDVVPALGLSLSPIDDWDDAEIFDIPFGFPPITPRPLYLQDQAPHFACLLHIETPNLKVQKTYRFGGHPSVTETMDLYSFVNSSIQTAAHTDLVTLVHNVQNIYPHVVLSSYDFEHHQSYLLESHINTFGYLRTVLQQRFLLRPTTHTEAAIALMQDFCLNHSHLLFVMHLSLVNISRKFVSHLITERILKQPQSAPQQQLPLALTTGMPKVDLLWSKFTAEFSEINSWLSLPAKYGKWYLAFLVAREIEKIHQEYSGVRRTNRCAMLDHHGNLFEFRPADLASAATQFAPIANRFEESKYTAARTLVVKAEAVYWQLRKKSETSQLWSLRYVESQLLASLEMLFGEGFPWVFNSNLSRSNPAYDLVKTFTIKGFRDLIQSTLELQPAQVLGRRVDS